MAPAQPVHAAYSPQPLKPMDKDEMALSFCVPLICLLGLNLVAFSIVGATGGLSSYTVGTVLLATSAAMFATYVFLALYVDGDKEFKCKMMVLYTLPLISFIVSAILGITNVVNGKVMALISFSPFGALIVGAGGYKSYRIIRKCIATCGVTEEMVAQKLAVNPRTSHYFHPHLDRKGLIASFMQVLTNDRTFITQSALRYLDINTIVISWDTRPEVKQALLHFFASHDPMLRFPFEYAIEDYNQQWSRNIAGIL